MIHGSASSAAAAPLDGGADPPRRPGRGDAVALARLIRPAEHWRLYPDLVRWARFVDIETLGLAETDPITLVGVSDGFSNTILVRGRDLTRRRVWEAFAGARLLVTFNGTAFDLPRLRRAFPGLAAWELPHLDLAVLGRRVGLSGGLKAVERRLGVRRPADLTEVDGLEAVRLWEAYRAGSPGALAKLTRYCQADTETLRALAAEIYARLEQQSQPRGAGWLLNGGANPVATGRSCPLPPPPPAPAPRSLVRLAR